jgi:hypothetical protein
MVNTSCGSALGGLLEVAAVELDVHGTAATRRTQIHVLSFFYNLR